MTNEILNHNNGNGRETRVDNWNGIKFFKGLALPDKSTLLALVNAITPDQLRDQKHVWRPEETIEAGQIFFNQSRINVVGPPQSGKGTILFGLSDMCDIMNIGYYFVDGHHQEVNPQVMANTIHQAEEKKIPVFYDSTDYLFLKSRSVGRDISLAAQLERIPIITSALDSATIPIAITSHDGEWAQEFLNLSLRAQYDGVFSRFPRYEIPLYLKSAASISCFLSDHKVPTETIQFLITMAENRLVIQELQNTYGEHTQEIFTAIKTYPVLKELTRDRAQDLKGVMERIFRKDTHSIADLGKLILEIEEKRKKLTHIRKQNKIKRN